MAQGQDESPGDHNPSLGQNRDRDDGSGGSRPGSQSERVRDVRSNRPAGDRVRRDEVERRAEDVARDETQGIGELADQLERDAVSGRDQRSNAINDELIRSDRRELARTELGGDPEPIPEPVELDTDEQQDLRRNRWRNRGRQEDDLSVAGLVDKNKKDQESSREDGNKPHHGRTTPNRDQQPSSGLNEKRPSQKAPDKDQLSNETPPSRPVSGRTDPDGMISGLRNDPETEGSQGEESGSGKNKDPKKKTREDKVAEAAKKDKEKRANQPPPFIGGSGSDGNVTAKWSRRAVGAAAGLSFLMIGSLLTVISGGTAGMGAAGIVAGAAAGSCAPALQNRDSGGRVVLAAAETDSASLDIGTGEPDIADWDAIAKCESSGNWSLNAGNGYFGGLQFDEGTWASGGGKEYAETADKASKEDQIRVALNVWRERGWQPWECATKVGYSGGPEGWKKPGFDSEIVSDRPVQSGVQESAPNDTEEDSGTADPEETSTTGTDDQINGPVGGQSDSSDLSDEEPIAMSPTAYEFGPYSINLASSSSDIDVLAQDQYASDSESGTDPDDAAIPVGEIPDHAADSAEITPKPNKNPTGSLTTLPVDGVTLDEEQIYNAEVIIGVADASGLGDKAAVIATATALQEDLLRNSDKARDHDSVGIFQQRPSVGWGTVEEIMDPEKATKAFFGIAEHTNNPGLVDIPGWESMPLSQAADAVQISFYPDAYAKWENTAKQIVAALTGRKYDPQNGPGTGVDDSCSDPNNLERGSCIAAVNGAPGESAIPASVFDSMKPDTVLVTKTVAEQFGVHTFYGYRPPDGYNEHFDGVAVDIMIEPTQDNPDIPRAPVTTEGVTHGDNIAKYLQENAAGLGIEYLIWKQSIWMSGEPIESWTPMEDRGGDTANHRDHIHANTFGNSSNGQIGRASTECANVGDGGSGAGMAANMEGLSPPADPSKYMISDTFGTRGGSHKGADVASYRAETIDLYSVHDGTVIEVITGCAPLTQDTSCGGGWGNHVVIDFGNGVGARYAHMSEVFVSQRDRVKAGQNIGKMGNSGWSEGVHLHFEQLDMNNNMVQVDPRGLLEKAGGWPNSVAD